MPNRVRQDADEISSVRFSTDGSLLAVGDRGGRVTVLKRIYRKRRHRSARKATDDGFVSAGTSPELPETMYRLHIANTRNSDSEEESDASDQSDMDCKLDHAARHDASEFHLRTGYEKPYFQPIRQAVCYEGTEDVFKAFCDESVREIEWRRHGTNTHCFMTANESTVKLWRIGEKRLQVMANLRAHEPMCQPVAPPQNLCMPSLQAAGHVSLISPVRKLQPVHQMSVHSLSLSVDDDTLLSADELCVYLWSMTRAGSVVRAIDARPRTTDVLTEVLTCARFHPGDSCTIATGTSSGTINLYDLRGQRVAKAPGRKLRGGGSQNAVARYGSGLGLGAVHSSFVDKVLTSISDVAFSPNGRLLLTRSYTHLQLWDLHMEGEPLMTTAVHDDFVSKRFWELYNFNLLFDGFRCAFSCDGGSLLTGSYNSSLCSYSAFSGLEASVQVGGADEGPAGLSGPVFNQFDRNGPGISGPGGHVAAGSWGLRNRIRFFDSSPAEQIVAIPVGSSLFLHHGFA